MRIFIASVGVVAIAVALALLALGDAVTSLGVLVVSMVVVFGVVFGDEYSRRRTSATLASRTVDVRTTAPPVDTELEHRLEEVMAANVVVFSGGDPFDGWGAELGKGWQVSIDATRPGTDQHGKPRPVTPFEPADLHKAMTLAVRGAGIPDLAVHNRLFVRGTAADHVPGLVPDPMDRPASVVAPALIRKGIDQPQPDVRTYLCIEKTAWGGELVVTLYVRVAQIRGDLFIECHAYLLLPLRLGLTAVDHTPTDAFRMLWASFAAAAKATLPTLRSCVADLSREALKDFRHKRQRRADMRTARRKMPLDRGAEVSLRALAADDERVFTFAYTDEEMHLNALQRRVLDAIHDFLDQHGIDTTAFRKKQTNIVNNNTYTIGNVNSTNTQIGGQNTINNQNNQQSGSQGGGNPSSTPPPWAGP